MTPDQTIAKALEQLESVNHCVEFHTQYLTCVGVKRIEAELAALIRAAAELFKIEHEIVCPICGNPVDEHAPDCALLALVDAINGEGGEGAS